MLKLATFARPLFYFRLFNYLTEIITWLMAAVIYSWYCHLSRSRVEDKHVDQSNNTEFKELHIAYFDFMTTVNM